MEQTGFTIFNLRPLNGRPQELNNDPALPSATFLTYADSFPGQLAIGGGAGYYIAQLINHQGSIYCYEMIGPMVGLTFSIGLALATMALTFQQSQAQYRTVYEHDVTQHQLRGQVVKELDALITKWDSDTNNTAIFKRYFITNKMWADREARNNPTAFAEKQRNLLAQMDNDPELRKACFALAVAGSSDCRDNAAAMFQKMQEKALEIAMSQPSVPMEELISYGLALENQAKLEQLIEATPALKRGINSGEGTEALLALQLLCHQKNIILPVPVTSMSYEEVGLRQFKGPEDGWFTSTTDIKCKISALLDNAIPGHSQPSAKFLAAQQFWQNYVSEIDPGINEVRKFIEAIAAARQGVEEEKLFGNNESGASHGEIEKNMLAIEQKRKKDIANLYLDETERLLSESEHGGRVDSS